MRVLCQETRNHRYSRYATRVMAQLNQTRKNRRRVLWLHVCPTAGLRLLGFRDPRALCARILNGPVCDLRRRTGCRAVSHERHGTRTPGKSFTRPPRIENDTVFLVSCWADTRDITRRPRADLSDGRGRPLRKAEFGFFGRRCFNDLYIPAAAFAATS